MYCVIDGSAKISPTAVIEDFVVIKGNCIVGENCVVGSSSYLENAVIGKNSVVKSSRIVNSRVGESCTIGPFAHLRDNAEVCDGCRIGNFVEIKNSVIGAGTKASHLAYVGDGCFVACGSTVVQDMPSGAFGIGRSRLTVKENAAGKYLK